MNICCQLVSFAPIHLSIQNLVPYLIYHKAPEQSRRRKRWTNVLKRCNGCGGAGGAQIPAAAAAWRTSRSTRQCFAPAAADLKFEGKLSALMDSNFRYPIQGAYLLQA